MSLLKSKNGNIVLIQKLMAGLAKHFPNQTLTLGNIQLTSAQIQARLQAYLTALQAVETTLTAWKAAVQALDLLRAAIEELIVNLNSFLRATFGATNAILLDFGIQPRQPSKRSVASKAAAISKSAVTRELRHTGGKRQKAAIKAGEAEPETSTEPTTPPATVPAKPAK